MPNADTVLICSYEERKAAVLRAAQLLQYAKGSDEDREFEMLTEAIAEFDILQESLGPVEIPPAFMQFIHGAGRRSAATSVRERSRRPLRIAPVSSGPLARSTRR
ncbi:hypothetical protein FG93_04594 [Bosea sp. LC85]|uniref:hypothetical protein n=1 Tax=Bosea sp. LC85 TaxID=1502851 RepID=UPI0004E39CD3|nr:hypothetical protein [Bosea sp. LC85]KFC65778.1 hypothetical protein FG93_04594 [Bosea sp. LC85]